MRRVSRAALITLAAAFVLSSVGAASPRREPNASPVDDLLVSCPSASQVAAIDADLQLRFEADPTAGTRVCTAAAGSADLTLLQRRVYGVLGAMKALSYARPLPWTSQGLYGWLVSAIDGIRFRNDIQFSSCCNPSGFINIAVAPSSYLMLTDRWVDPTLGGGLQGGGLDATAALFAHEARHNEGKGHTCGTNDQTLPELGSWGVQYYLHLWDGLFSGTFLDAPVPSTFTQFSEDRARYRAVEITAAESTLERICSLPSADLSIAARDAPDPVETGSRLTYTLQVANAGPATAPEVFVQAETPPGTRFAAASASQGSCTGPELGGYGPVGCALGALSAGGTATVRITLTVDATAAPSIGATPGYWSAHVTPSARDPIASNNSASVETDVVYPQATRPTSCSGSPGKGGVKRVGTAHGNTLKGTPRDDVICGAGGKDRISGLGGRDVLRGDADNDRIDGGPGPDRISGGSGDDTIVTRDGARDVVSCGSGRDTVLADRLDTIARDCEDGTLRV